MHFGIGAQAARSQPIICGADRSERRQRVAAATEPATLGARTNNSLSTSYALVSFSTSYSTPSVYSLSTSFCFRTSNSSFSGSVLILSMRASWLAISWADAFRSLHRLRREKRKRSAKLASAEQSSSEMRAVAAQSRVGGWPHRTTEPVLIFSCLTEFALAIVAISRLSEAVGWVGSLRNAARRFPSARVMLAPEGGRGFAVKMQRLILKRQANPARKARHLQTRASRFSESDGLRSGEEAP